MHTRNKLKIAVLFVAATGAAAAVAQSGPPDRGDGGPPHGFRFEHADTDGDGAVDEAEFVAAALARHAAADADGDGQATLAEIEAAFRARMEAREARGGAPDGDGPPPGGPNGGGPAGRRGFDGPHGGSHGGPHGGPPEGPGDRFAQHDLNGDGAIDAVEADEAARARFARMDADADGALTPADREAHRERVRDCMESAAGEAAED